MQILKARHLSPHMPFKYELQYPKWSPSLLKRPLKAASALIQMKSVDLSICCHHIDTPYLFSMSVVLCFFPQWIGILLLNNDEDLVHVLKIVCQVHATGRQQMQLGYSEHKSVLLDSGKPEEMWF